MNKEQAEKEARQICVIEDVAMIVTFNPYAETLDEADKFSYHPALSHHLFEHERIVTFFHKDVIKVNVDG